jgi:hypothetical protein
LNKDPCARAALDHHVPHRKPLIGHGGQLSVPLLGSFDVRRTVPHVEVEQKSLDCFPALGDNLGSVEIDVDPGVFAIDVECNKAVFVKKCS